MTENRENGAAEAEDLGERIEMFKKDSIKFCSFSPLSYKIIFFLFKGFLEFSFRIFQVPIPGDTYFKLRGKRY